MRSSLHKSLVTVILATLSFASTLPANEVETSGQEGSATQPAKPRSQRRAERRERRRVDSNRAMRELTVEVQSLRAEVRLLRERIDQLEGKYRSPADKARRVVESLKTSDGSADRYGPIPSGVRFERPPLQAFKPEAREALRNGASYLDRVSNIPFNHRSWVDPSDVMDPTSLVRKKAAE